jgi:hypothetical protein
MSIYARIDSGRVAELFETDGDITTMFNPAIVWVDVTGMDPEPGVGWSYDGQSFDAPAVVTLSELRAALCVSVDAAADTAYIAIGGPSPGRLAEYKQAKADADAFKAAGYAGSAPDTIACWAEARAWTDQQACDDILATAASWEMALAVIRRQRLIGKANVNAAADAAAAQAAADAAMAVIQSIPAGAG